jgi:hypothetical protein
MRRLRMKVFRLGSGSGGLRYRNMILAIPNLLYALPLNELAGSTALDISGSGRNGSYTAGITLGQAGLGDSLFAPDYAPLWDGSASKPVNLYSTSLRDAWTPGEVTLSLFIKSAAAAWSDTLSHYAQYFYIENNNRIGLLQPGTANQFSGLYVAGGTINSCTIVNYNSTEWYNAIFRISKSEDAADLFINGGQPDPETNMHKTGLGDWVGTLTALNTALAYTRLNGQLAWGCAWGRALTPAEILTVSACRGRIIFDGDSRTGGSTFYPQRTMSTAGTAAKRYQWRNIGVSGQKLSDMITRVPTHLVPIGTLSGKRNIVIAWAGVNDAANGADAATMYNRMVAYCALVRAAGHQVFVGTEIDGQSAALNAVNYHTVIWPAYNALLRDNWTTFADGMIDFGADARLQDATNPTYFNAADQLHPADGGWSVLAEIASAYIAAH